jgi:hypothetical protein
MYQNPQINENDKENIVDTFNNDIYASQGEHFDDLWQPSLNIFTDDAVNAVNAAYNSNNNGFFASGSLHMTPMTSYSSDEQYNQAQYNNVNAAYDYTNASTGNSVVPTMPTISYLSEEQYNQVQYNDVNVYNYNNGPSTSDNVSSNNYNDGLSEGDNVLSTHMTMPMTSSYSSYSSDEQYNQAQYNDVNATYNHNDGLSVSDNVLPAYMAVPMTSYLFDKQYNQMQYDDINSARNYNDTSDDILQAYATVPISSYSSKEQYKQAQYNDVNSYNHNDGLSGAITFFQHT